ncbi:helix-turn-helix domain-containing protein [Streptomyces sp. OE57]|uniref:helix-turn-helix domain-containing protein n=1 Tax=Streptomyces lacaronensis TaxID=3379885 RepID=UPI0039B7491B
MPRWRDLPEELDPQVRVFTGQLCTLVERSGLSVVAVADRTGYSKSSWRRCLNGRPLPGEGPAEGRTARSGAAVRLDGSGVPVSRGVGRAGDRTPPSRRRPRRPLRRRPFRHRPLCHRPLRRRRHCRRRRRGGASVSPRCSPGGSSARSCSSPVPSF